MFNMQVDKIIHIEVNKIGRASCQRDMISINGMSFYRSSGNNSLVAGTWFPFFGIETKKPKGILGGKGWIIKKGWHHFPAEFEARINQLEGQELPLRFSSIPALLISSHLGGGLWESEAGIKLKNELMEEYPDFYKTWPTINVVGETIIPDDESINTWLLNKAKLNSVEDLKKECITDVKDLKLPEKLEVPTQLEASKSNNYLSSINVNDLEKLTQVFLDFCATEGKKTDPKHAPVQAYKWLIGQYNSKIIVKDFEELKNNFIATLERGLKRPRKGNQPLISVVEPDQSDLNKAKAFADQKEIKIPEAQSNTKDASEKTASTDSDSQETDSNVKTDIYKAKQNDIKNYFLDIIDDYNPHPEKNNPEENWEMLGALEDDWELTKKQTGYFENYQGSNPNKKRLDSTIKNLPPKPENKGFFSKWW